MLEPAAPVGGALLIHGLSDAPYSLRAVAERLHAEGFTVIGLRVPGHGTSPKNLEDVSTDTLLQAVVAEAEALLDGNSFLNLVFQSMYATSVIPSLPQLSYEVKDGNYGSVVQLQNQFLQSWDYVLLLSYFAIVVFIGNYFEGCLRVPDGMLKGAAGAISVVIGP